MTFYRGNKETGLALLRRATQISPSFATAQQWLGTSLATARDLGVGLALLQRASELDPRSAIVANNYGWFLIAAERTADAIAVCGRVLAAAGDTPLCLEIDALARVIQDGPEAARDSFERWARAAGNPSDPDRVVDLLGALEGRNDRRAVAERPAATPVHSGWVGTGMMFQCDPRFRAVGDRLGYVDGRAAKVCAGKG